MALSGGSGKVAHKGTRIYWYDSLKGEDACMMRDSTSQRRDSFLNGCWSRRFERFDERRKFSPDPSNQWMDDPSGNGY